MRLNTHPATCAVRRTNFLKGSTALLVICLILVGLPPQPCRAGQAWPTSSPEKQGLDSSRLAEAVNFVLRENLRGHSLLIIRNGFIVADVYFYPFAAETRHDVASVTKSVTSTLIGIAIDKGIVKSVSQPLLDLYGDRKIGNLDERKKALTMEHLLTMQSGLRCISSPTELTLFEMMASPDWVQFMLDLPMTDAPGTRFNYNSGGVHLLSDIIRKSSGLNALQFARRHLFDPLGISDVVWPLDSRGEDNHGWGDLQLRPRDLAKIAQLFLDNGQWQGRQIVSADWVREATRRRLSLPQGEGYGYLWWMPGQPAGLIEARGRGGQRLIIWPEKNTVIVVTGGGFEPGKVGPFLVEAIRSDEPLPPNPDGLSRLEAAAKRAASPPPQPKRFEGVSWPETAQAVSDRRFLLERNPRGIQALTLIFKDRSEAILRLDLTPGAIDQTRFELLLGLDGLPRLAPGRSGVPAACSGTWRSKDTFVADIDEVGNINHLVIELTFRGDEVTGKIADKTGLGSLSLRGKRE